MRTGVWGPNWLKCGSDRGFSNLFQNKMKCEIDVLKKRSKRSVKFGQQGQSSHAQLNSYLSITKTLYFQNNCVPLILWNFNFCISTGRDKIWGWKGVARNKSFIILDASLDLPQCPGVTIISQWEASIRLWVTNERPASGSEWPMSGQETTDLRWHDAGKLITCPYLLLKPIVENVDYLYPTLSIFVCLVCGVPSTPSQPQARNLRNIFGP